MNILPSLYAAKKASAANHKKTHYITVRPKVLLAHQVIRSGHWGILKGFFKFNSFRVQMVRVTEHWHRLPRVIVEFAFCEELKSCLLGDIQMLSSVQRSILTFFKISHTPEFWGKKCNEISKLIFFSVLFWKAKKKLWVEINSKMSFLGCSFV